MWRRRTFLVLAFLGACGGEADDASKKQIADRPAAKQSDQAPDSAAPMNLREFFGEGGFDPIHPAVRIPVQVSGDESLEATGRDYERRRAAAREKARAVLDQFRASGRAANSAELERAFGPLVSALDRDGEARQAAQLLGEWRAELDRADAAGDSRAAQQRVQLTGRMALAWTRVGELENCVARHNAECCTLPLRGGALHEEREGSERGLALWAEFLAAQPDNLTARWLMNVCAMTLGEWPQAVPQAWRMDPARMAGEGDFAPMLDVAPGLGLDVLSSSGGCVLEDFDGDGDIDVLFSDWLPSAPMRSFDNEGGGSFEESTEARGLVGQFGALNLNSADANGDGRVDVYAMRGGWGGPQRNSLLVNDGEKFADEAEQRGLARPTRAGQASAWGDVDLDGDLDLFACVENFGGRKPDLRCQLFQNDGEGNFTDVAAAAGVDMRGYAKGCALGDVDNDGDPELYVSMMDGPNRFFLNLGKGQFEEATEAFGVALPSKSFPTWFFDYDQDGWLDLFVASYEFSSDVVLANAFEGEPAVPSLRLYRNLRGTGFEDVTKAAGLSRCLPVMGANFGDLNADGFPEIFLGTGTPSYASLSPSAFFANRGGKHFELASAAARLGNLQKGHGVALADLDGDGDLDLVQETGGAKPGDAFPNAVYENPGHGNHWLAIDVRSSAGNRFGLGCRIEVRLPGGIARHALVSSGGSFGSSPMRQFIGLGQATEVEQIIVRWPDGHEQRLEDAAMDTTILIERD